MRIEILLNRVFWIKSFVYAGVSIQRIGRRDEIVGIRDEASVVYQSEDGKEQKTFDALEWLGAMCSHVPNKGEQIVRYY